MTDSNPLGILELDGETYIPLKHISEDEVERLRSENLQANTIDSTAEELGEPAPGIKDAQVQMAAEAQKALDAPISKDAKSPADGLG